MADISNAKSSNKIKKNNIILIGFMGSGKTTIGLKLSYKLQLAVEDTDKIIETRQKRTIKEIFATEGEGYFRKLELELLYEIRDSVSRKIYSLGGGTPIQLQNQSIMCQCGKVIYLRAKPETIYDRLKGDTTRPLLQCDDPLARIRELIDKRKFAYERCADYIIDVDEMDQAEIVERIVRFVNEEEYS